MRMGLRIKRKARCFSMSPVLLSISAPRPFYSKTLKIYLAMISKTFQIIRQTLKQDLGYHIYYKVIDARNIVLQHRERIYIVGFKDPLLFDFPTFIDLKPKLKDILDNTVAPKYTLTDHLWTYLQNYAEKHKAKGNGFGFGLSDLEGVTRTLSARYYKDGSEILVPQPNQNPRRLTPRECARIMGYPDSFKIVCSDTRAYKQFGNSVAVPVVAQIAKSLIARLKNPVERTETYYNLRLF